MYTHSHKHGWKHHYGWRKHKHGWPVILFVGLAAIFLIGPIFSFTFFLIKLALTLLPIVIVGALVVFGVRAVMRASAGGDWRNAWRDDWDTMKQRFQNEAERWKDKNDDQPRKRKNDDYRVERDPEDGSETYHI
jgi:hypothetical protein